MPQRAYAEEILDREMQRLEWIGERALAHEAVVEHFLRADAVLPMQLFTLFMTDQRAVEHVTGDFHEPADAPHTTIIEHEPRYEEKIEVGALAPRKGTRRKLRKS